MANNQNLIPFTERTEEERREFGRKGGKASGEARRRKADFKKTLNAILTTEFEDENAAAIEAMGLQCTVESAMNMILIKKALTGDVRAYEVIAKYSGQDTEKEVITEKHKAMAEKLRAEVEQIRNTNGMTTEDKVAALFSKIDEALEKEPFSGEGFTMRCSNDE